MPHVIHIPRRFDASYSLLGTWLRRRTGDERRAEALLIIMLAGIGLGLVLLHYMLWMLLRPQQAAGNVLLYFWAAQAGLWLAAFATCALGFRPAIVITLAPEGIEATQGRRRSMLRRGDVRHISVIPALLFHRHYRRYAGTRVFVNRVEAELLLLHVDGGHVVLGVASAQQKAIIHHLAESTVHPMQAVVQE